MSERYDIERSGSTVLIDGVPCSGADGDTLELSMRQLLADIAERDALIADYRDEFSGLCHALSVGSEGRPEMAAADWRKRVDQGIDFLTRPLLSRIEAAGKELAKRSNMLDICTQNCSDWIGRWNAEQDRAEQAEAELARLRVKINTMLEILSEELTLAARRRVGARFNAELDNRP